MRGVVTLYSRQVRLLEIRRIRGSRPFPPLARFFPPRRRAHSRSRLFRQLYFLYEDATGFRARLQNHKDARARAGHASADRHTLRDDRGGRDALTREYDFDLLDDGAGRDDAILAAAAATPPPPPTTTTTRT